MDTAKLLSLLKVCANSKSLRQGKLIHQKVITLGLQKNMVFCKNIIGFYFSCQSHDSAKLVFKNIDNSLDISLWNGMMAAYSKNFMNIDALDLFGDLLVHPYLKPDSYTYPSVLKACAGLGMIGYGRMIHTCLLKSGFIMDVVVGSSVVGMYAKCNAFVYAIQMFDEMLDRDVACWNTVISCYFQDGKFEKALEYFEKMSKCGFEHDSVTFTTAIASCGRLLDLKRGQNIHRELEKSGLVFDSYVNSALVDMYGKCGQLESAKAIFEQITKKTVVAWNSIIAGWSAKGDSLSCIQFLKRMTDEGVKPTLTTLSSILIACSRSVQLLQGKLIHGYIIRNKIEPDIFVNSSLMDLYFKCGMAALAENVFKNMSKSNIVSWNVMISGYVTAGNYFQALDIFSEMRKANVKPDAITFTSVLPACSQLAALDKGKEIHNLIVERKLENIEVVMGALLDMYSKCGAVDEAYKVFNSLPERDLVSWTSMITAYGSHGHVSEAVELFREMLHARVQPDRVTFLAILSACSHAGLVDEGCYLFNQMINDYHLKPRTEHYACLIDLLGRAGRLREAYKIIQSNPEISDDTGLLSTLFASCRLHKNYELGVEIAKSLIEKDPDDPSTYIILASIYASNQKWDEVRNLRSQMKERGLKKNPGCSWIEIHKRILPFFAEDSSHPQAELLDDCLANLASHMEKDEFIPSLITA